MRVNSFSELWCKDGFSLSTFAVVTAGFVSTTDTGNLTYHLSLDHCRCCRSAVHASLAWWLLWSAVTAMRDAETR